MEEIVYTVVIPHRNTLNLLQRCLDSIPRRKDVQIIVVDDNSDPDVVDFSTFPGLGDPYVEVIFGKNENNRKGAGYARNLGLERAKGKWLVFADADDFFNPGFEAELDKYGNTDYDLVFFYVNSVNSETLESTNRGDSCNELCKHAKESNCMDDVLYRRYAPWGKFVSRKLVEDNQIRFQERPVANDVYFSMITGYYAENVYISESQVYCTTERVGSLEMTDTFKRYKEYFDAICEIYNSMKDYQIESYLEDMICYWWYRMKEKNPVFTACFFWKLFVSDTGKIILRRYKYKIISKLSYKSSHKLTAG
jgi:glycosyltransferase involved in cell wall biosynthesis